MTKTKFVAFCLAVLCFLSACGNKETVPTVNNLPVASSVGVDPDTGEWKGTGGAYTVKKIDIPENTSSAIIVNNNYYYLTWAEGSQIESTSQQNEQIVLYKAIDEVILDISASEEGIWIFTVTYSGAKEEFILRLISFNGEELRSISLDSVEQVSPITPMSFAAGNFYINCEDALIILDESGNYTGSIKLSDSTSTSIIIGNDGLPYVVEKTDNSSNVYDIDPSSAKLLQLFSFGTGSLHTGNSDHLFTLENNNGLYGIEKDGNSSTILLWKECNLSFGTVNEVIALEDNNYHLFLGSDSYLLTPSNAADITTKIKLDIASIGLPDSLSQSLTRFNSNRSDYYVNVVDYTSGGDIETADAISALNIDILSGNLPDMFCFQNLSPYSYISKSYVTNMKEYFDEDDEISLDDIIIANALEYDDGIYYISSIFSMYTMAGLYTTFGDRNGWTLEEFLDMESALPDGADMIYNNTKENFAYNLSSRYIRTAIDWTQGTCDFESDEFIEILKTCNSIDQNPEDLNNLDYTPSAVRVSEGNLIAGSIGTDFVWELAYEESLAGAELSCIGWPTVDGSCGTDISLHEPVGIVSQGSNQDGCWEFVKYLLMEDNTGANSESYGLSTYKPILDSQVQDAMTNQKLSVQMTETDKKKLYKFLSGIENVDIYDNNILAVILEEAATYFSGDKTAEEAAKIIQNRVSTYVNEQTK